MSTEETELKLQEGVLSDTSDLDETISQLRANVLSQASSTEVEANVRRMQSLHELSRHLQVRFQQKAHIDDLEDAIELGHQIESLAIFIDHPYLSWLHHCIVLSSPSHNEMFPGSGRLSNWTNTSAQDRFASAVSCANSARALGQYTLAIRAYKLALLLSDRCTIIQFNIDLQRQFLSRPDARQLASKAAACAIEAGDLKAAVEMIEQGRGRIWSVLRDGAYPLDHLIEVAPELAETFRETGAKLELLSATPSDHDLFADVRPQQLRAALETWNDTLTKIRQINGFSDILRPKSFDSLTPATVDGPVIILNIDMSSRSDAIILHHDDDPILIPLSGDDLSHVIPRSSQAVASLNTHFRSSRSWRPSKDTLTTCLQLLWRHVCKSVVDRLLEMGIPEQSRIWWYPPGIMASLPIHAAGPYTEGKRSLPDIFVSSYTSSLLAIIRARADPGNSVRGVKLLAIGQSDVLPHVTSELQNLGDIFGDRAVIRVNSEATREQVLDDLRQSGERGACTHFACHGSLNLFKPLDSSFVMHDGNLTLRDIVDTSNLGFRHLAFLALCHSAASGDVEDAPDEFISLATGVQVSGFRSVVGTLWTMADVDGPALARDFYSYLTRKGAYEFDPRDTAVSLHLAVQAMRKRGVPVERWSTFVHIGL